MGRRLFFFFGPRLHGVWRVGWILSGAFSMGIGIHRNEVDRNWFFMMF
jgi:hypothetical protein